MTVLPSELPAALQAPPSLPDARPSRARQIWLALRAVLLGGLAGALIGLAWLQAQRLGWMPAWSLRSGLPLAGWLACLLPVLWASIVVHELGHLGAARLAGWRPFLFVVGPVQLRFGASWRWRWGRMGPGAAGLAASLPPAQGRVPQPWQFAAKLAGGPLANALLALAGGALGSSAAAAGSPLLLALAQQLVLVNVLMALINLAPFKTGGYSTDGFQLRQVLRRDPAIHELLALVLLQAHALAGVRPRDWDADLLRQVAGARHDSRACLFGPLIRHAAALDQGRTTEAHDALVQYAEQLHAGAYAQMPVALRCALLLPVVTHLAQECQAGPAAQAWWSAAEALPQGLAQAHDRLHAQAALAATQGRAGEAASLAQAALAALARSGLAEGAQASTREKLQALLAPC